MLWPFLQRICPCLLRSINIADRPPAAVSSSPISDGRHSRSSELVAVLVPCFDRLHSVAQPTRQSKWTFLNAGTWRNPILRATGIVQSGGSLVVKKNLAAGLTAHGN